MNPFAAALLIAVLSLLGSCGEDSSVAAAGASDEPALESDPPSDHFVSVTVDGVGYQAQGTLFGPTMIFSGPEINVQVGGPLTSAVADGEAVSLGDFDLSLNLLTNSIEPGAYRLVSNRNRVTRSEEPLGFAELFFPDSVDLGKLSPLSGTITVKSVEGSEVNGRYRLRKASGTAAGRFRGRAGQEHAVEVEFVYHR